MFPPTLGRRLLLVFAVAAGSRAAIDASGYRVPPESLAAIITAPLPPSARLSPDRSILLSLHRPGLPSIEELSGPELGLAGIRFNPETRSPPRERTFDRLEIHLRPARATGE